MRVILFGATGFIGKNLTEHLHSNGYKVTIVTRSLKKAKSLFNDKIEILEWDYSNTNTLSRLIKQMDVIINLAGENIAGKLWTKKQRKKIIDSRIKPGQLLSKAISLAEKKPNLFIQASAIGYYGYQTTSECDESNPVGAGFLASVCESWEKSTATIEQQNVKRIILRTGVVLGKTGGMFPKLLFPIKHFAGSNFGKGENFISWIHIHDLVRSIEFLIQNDCEGVFNLTSPKPVTSKKLNSCIAKRIHRPIWIRIPKVIIQLLMGRLATELILSNQQVVPKNLVKTGFEFKYDTIYNAMGSLV